MVTDDMSDLNIEAHENRAHRLAMTRIICRYTAATVIAVVAAVAWRCDPDAAAREMAARQECAESRGVANECRRWTP